MIVSLAREAGATVWGQTGAQEKAAAIVESGAERVVVGGPDKLAEQISPLEPTVAFDPLGGDYVAPVVQSLAHRGRMVSFGTSAGAEVTFDMQQLYRKMLSLLGYGGGQLRPEERRSGLEDALAALRDGAIRVRVDEVLALERVNEAFARLSERRVQGKLLLDLS
jgi:NADPH2:quinone reductase